jgi:peptide/nickel transport system ATP-binding protein
MYGGRIVESAATERVFRSPQHPYSDALLASIPRFDAPPHTRLRAVGGQPPNMLTPPAGCRFAPRCPYVAAGCADEMPQLRSVAGEAHTVACHHPLTSTRTEVGHGR